MRDNEENDWELINHLQQSESPRGNGDDGSESDSDSDSGEIEKRADAILSSSSFESETQVNTLAKPFLRNVVLPVVRHQTKKLIRSRFVWSQAAMWMIRVSWSFDWRVNMVCSSVGVCVLAIQNRQLIRQVWWR